jgi:hypothetical protein
MKRYILIHNRSGFIFGDSANFDGEPYLDDPYGFAEAVCASLDPSGELWCCGWIDGRDTTANGFYYYRADLSKGEAVPLALDWQDQATIDAIERDCPVEGTIWLAEEQCKVTKAKFEAWINTVCKGECAPRVEIDGDFRTDNYWDSAKNLVGYMSCYADRPDDKPDYFIMREIWPRPIPSQPGPKPASVPASRGSVIPFHLRKRRR